MMVSSTDTGSLYNASEVSICVVRCDVPGDEDGGFVSDAMAGGRRVLRLIVVLPSGVVGCETHMALDADIAHTVIVCDGTAMFRRGNRPVACHGSRRTEAEGRDDGGRRRAGLEVWRGRSGVLLQSVVTSAPLGTLGSHCMVREGGR